MNPLVADYLAKKYPEKFAELAAEREKVAKEYDQTNEAPGVGGNLLMGLVGALKSDKSYADVANDERLQREAERENVIKPVDEKQKALVNEMSVSDKALEGERSRVKAGREDIAYKREDDAFQKESDPTSEESKLAQGLAKSLGFKGDVSQLTASKWKSFGPYFEKRYAIEQKGIESKLAREARDQANEDRKNEKDDKNRSALTTTLYRETRQGPLGELNKMRTMAAATKANIDQFIKNPSGYSDYGTLMSSLKSLQGDTSVVREAELKLGKNATSLINKAANSIQQAINGEALQPEQRKQIADVMSVLVDSYSSAFNSLAKPIVVRARKNNIPLEEIFDSPEAFEEKAAKVKVSNGSEELLIDPADIEDAKADGYEVVE